MNARRELTAAEKAASESFIKALDKSGYTQESIAAELEMSLGNINHWYKLRTPIPAVRAPQVAMLLNTSPSEISAEFATSIAPYIAPAARSHGMRIEGEILTIAIELANKAVALRGEDELDFHGPVDQAIVAQAINFILDHNGHPVTDSLIIEFMRTLGAKNDIRAGQIGTTTSQPVKTKRGKAAGAASGAETGSTEDGGGKGKAA